jgi:hypothetical protein
MPWLSPSSSSSSAPDFFLAWPARVVTMINVYVLNSWFQTDFPTKRVHPIPYTK